MAKATSVTQTIRIPQLGEGLTVVKIVELHKQAGDSVIKDEVLYSIETDKTTVDIESPCSGRLVEWLAAAEAVIAVGEAVANIATERSTSQGNGESHSQNKEASDDRHERTELAATAPHENAKEFFVPPRMRAFCRERGIRAEEISAIAAAKNGLTMEMVEQYVAEKRRGNGAVIQNADGQDAEKQNAENADQPLSNQQRWLNEHFKRSQAQVIPATLVASFSLASFGKANKSLLKSARFSSYASEFQLFAFWVSRVAATFPHFKSRLVNDKQRREHPHVNLGIAVQTENGELVTAAIKRSDTFEFATFMDEIKSKTHEALAGRDRAADDLSLILSYTAGRTILFGTPLLVAPAVATLFFGIPDQERRKPDGQAYLSLTFDHRLINGVEATAFLDAIANQFAQTELDDDKQATRQAERGGDKLRTRESLEAALIDKLVELLSIPADEIDEQESLGLLGLDSIKAITLKNYLEQLFSMALPATLLWHCPNVKSLLDYCASAQKLSSQKIATQKAADVEETAASTEELGDVEKILSALEGLPELQQRVLLDDAS